MDSLAEGGFNTMRYLQLTVNADVWMERIALIH
jgi:hypothetical protein